MIQASRLQSQLDKLGYGRILSRQTCSGGSINAAARLECEGGVVFMKSGANADRDHFRMEARGLEILAKPGAIRVPEVLAVTDDALLLEYIAPGPKSPAFWRQAGEALATLHRQSGPEFGLDFDNYCGATPQPNPWTPDGHTFFAEQRLLYQAALALEAGHLSEHEIQQVERICRRLDSLIPEMPAVLIHGDLWSGNLMADADGKPVLIDPACHYGWAEADLAMTCLFGGFTDEFYSAYVASSELDRHWRQRIDLYNLYHLLNHLNLFGSGYHGQVKSVLRSYS